MENYTKNNNVIEILKFVVKYSDEKASVFFSSTSTHTPLNLVEEYTRNLTSKWAKLPLLAKYPRCTVLIRAHFIMKPYLLATVIILDDL